MKHVEVPLKLDVIMPKDLNDNQEICPHCHGTGLIINEYSFGVCIYCNHGIVDICKHCGKPLPKYVTTCHCEGAIKERHLKWKETAFANGASRYNKATKITLDEAFKKFEYLYVDETDELIYLDDEEDYIISSIKEAQSAGCHIFGTKKEYLTLDANSILESACEELHEDAFINICDNIDKLQKQLDSWVEEYGDGTTTYYPDYNYTIEGEYK